MLLGAAATVLWIQWVAGGPMDPQVFVRYLVIVGALTTSWYVLLLVMFPTLSQMGVTTGVLTGILVNVSIALLPLTGFLIARSLSSEPGAKAAILGLEITYGVLALLMFLGLAGWRIILVDAIGGWLAQHFVMSRPSNSSLQPTPAPRRG